ncbi:hypothetical protein BX070DRAFT_225346 [Coemansia spiralis]|nr:hypothetical protein BX070DRAFT_225346 [Coemansia spiralis]
MLTISTASSALGRRTLGLFLLICVVFIWVGSSFLVSNLFGEQEFNRPFLITYINTSSFSLYLLNKWISRAWSSSNQPSTAHAVPKHRNSDVSDGGSQNEGSALMTADEPRNVAQMYPQDAQPRLSTRETVRLGVGFCVLWFAANITQNASLAYTSVASSSILCSTSGLFTLLIGTFAGVEKLNVTKVCAVLASFVGVYSIVKHGADAPGPLATSLSWVGDLLALTSAALYGCYTTLLKRRVGDESRLDMPLFFGSVGVANILLLWPGFPLLHFLGIEPFELPRSSRMWAMVAINALVGTFLSDYLWLMSMLMTSPLIVTLGLSLTIPLSMTGDILFKGLSVSLPYCFGALLVLGAFIVANL